MKFTVVASLALVAAANARSLPALNNRAVDVRGGAATKAVAPAAAPAAVTAAPAAKEFQLVIGGVDVLLLSYFALWFLGNYYYNIWNKLALKAAGGSSGYPMTISTLQIGVGCIYGALLWLIPGLRKAPTTTSEDIKAFFPVAFTNMGAHSASVFALSAGGVSFGQIVKSAEPAFAAVIGTLLYKKHVSVGKWLMLIPVIGGVIIASQAGGGHGGAGGSDFTWAALISACIANTFAAVKGNENKKLMDTAGIKQRVGGVGNQFAITSILSFFLAIPLIIFKEGHKFGGFVELLKTNKVVRENLILSGLSFYLYNELATKTIEKTNAVTQSVANTAKRVIVIIGSAIAFGESLEPLKLLGCAIGVFGVFLYSIIDNVFPPKKH